MLPFLADFVDADLGAVLVGGGVIDMSAGADDFRMADFAGRASSGGGSRRGGSTAAASNDTCESFFFSFGSVTAMMKSMIMRRCQSTLNIVLEVLYVPFIEAAVCFVVVVGGGDADAEARFAGGEPATGGSGCADGPLTMSAADLGTEAFCVLPSPVNSMLKFSTTGLCVIHA